jgi:hypothetical protein
MFIVVLIGILTKNNIQILLKYSKEISQFYSQASINRYKYKTASDKTKLFVT